MRVSARSLLTSALACLLQVNMLRLDPDKSGAFIERMRFRPHHVGSNEHLADADRARPVLGRAHQPLADATTARRIVHDEAGLIPLHQQALNWGVSKKVKIVQRADNQILFYWAQKE